MKLITISLLFSTLVVSCKSKSEESLKNKKAVVEHIKFDDIPLDTISKGITRRWFHAEKGQMTIFYLKLFEKRSDRTKII